jgi:hypothetical protein
VHHKICIAWPTLSPAARTADILPLTISRLESPGYEGHSLANLRCVASVLNATYHCLFIIARIVIGVTVGLGAGFHAVLSEAPAASVMGIIARIVIAVTVGAGAAFVTGAVVVKAAPTSRTGPIIPRMVIGVTVGGGATFPCAKQNILAVAISTADRMIFIRLLSLYGKLFVSDGLEDSRGAEKGGSRARFNPDSIIHPPVYLTYSA